MLNTTERKERNKSTRLMCTFKIKSSSQKKKATKLVKQQPNKLY